MTELLDPTDESERPTVKPAAALDQLEGATIGLLDISKPLGDIFLDQVSELLQAQGATVKRFSKPTFTKVAPFDLRAEIATQCQGVIEALAD